MKRKMSHKRTYERDVAEFLSKVSAELAKGPLSPILSRREAQTAEHLFACQSKGAIGVTVKSVTWEIVAMRADDMGVL